MSIVAAILVFSVIVVIHELGHFLGARSSGIYVEEFAIGMGPKLIGITRKGTLFSIRLFPIGGFCKMLGEDAESEDDRAFGNKKLWKRVMTISMGVIFNFMLALIIFTLLIMIGNVNEPVVSRLIEDSPAEAAGLLPGDRIIRVDGSKVNIYEDLSYSLNESGSKPVTIVLMRDGVRLEKVITPMLDEESGLYLIGFEMTKKTGLFAASVEGLQRAGIFESIANGFWRILFYIKITLLGIIKLVTLKISPDQMSGPIGIVDMISQTYQSSISVGIRPLILNLLQFVAILSANLGVFNLLPLPALDGGRLIFLTLEGIRGKPVPAEKEGIIHFVGFVLLILLAIFIAYNDIIKLFR